MHLLLRNGEALHSKKRGDTCSSIYTGMETTKAES